MVSQRMSVNPCLASITLQTHHPLDRAPRPRGDRRIDHDLLLEVDEAVEDLRQRDPLHVRAEIARPHELDVGQLGLHVVGHRALGDHDHAARPVLAHPVDHAGGRAGIVRLLDHVGRAFRMRDDLQRRVALAVAAQLLGGEALVHLAGARPGDDLHLGLRRRRIWRDTGRAGRSPCRSRGSRPPRPRSTRCSRCRPRPSRRPTC